MIINNYWTIIFAIGILIGFVIVRCCKKSKEWCADIWMTVLISEVLFFLASLVLCFGLYAWSNTSTKSTYTTKTELVALNDYTGFKEQLHGNYFLFFGSINSEKSDTYNVRFAYKDSNDIIRIQSKDMNFKNIGFYEDNQNIMEVTHVKNTFELDYLGKFLFKSSMGQISDVETDYIFHIPKDSIIKDINIDLK